MVLWCGVVVVTGPALNFVRDATQEYPFYDHGAAVAVVIGVVLSVMCALIFSPALVAVIGDARARSQRRNLVAGAVLGAFVGAAHVAGYLLAESELFGSAGWLAAYPIASALTWLSLLWVGDDSTPMDTAVGESDGRDRQDVAGSRARTR
jgi:hypothetical protein